MNVSSPSGESSATTFPIPPVTPVLDEDGDGELRDEIPLDADGDTWFTDDYPWPVDRANPPRYADGVERTEHAYFNATMEHIAHSDGTPGNYDAVTSIRSQRFFDTPRQADGMTPADMNWGLVPDIIESGVAIYNFADWWDAFARVFADGAVVRVTTSLYPTSWLFREGHGIRLSIAAADWPVFDLYPQLSPRNRPDAKDNIVPTITIHRGGEEGSYVELPVIPR